MSRKVPGCPVEFVVGMVGGKWKVLILWHLTTQPRRFAELKRKIPGVTEKMLTQQLRELERDRLVHREIYKEVPPRVEYSLTDYGQSLSPIILQLNDWGLEMYSKLYQDEYSVEEGSRLEAGSSR